MVNIIFVGFAIQDQIFETKFHTLIHSKRIIFFTFSLSLLETLSNFSTKTIFSFDYKSLPENVQHVWYGNKRNAEDGSS